MITGDYKKLEDLANRNVCSEHKTPLVVAWLRSSTWVLRCGHGDHYPESITRNPSVSELYRQGTLAEGPVANNIKKKEAKKQMTQEKQTRAVTFSGIPAVDLATGELLLPEVVKALATYAVRYQLDPARGHVVMMYGKPYITIDGYLYHANQEKIPYQLNSRPLTESERKDYQIEEGSHAWVSEVKMAAGQQSFTGQGIVTREEMTAKSHRDTTKLKSPVVAKYPWQLAQKRAEWQALRRAFPIGETEEVKDAESK